MSPKSKDFISIIIVTYNAEKYIRNCLDSVFALNFDQFCVVIIDNNSNDKTLEYLKNYINDRRIHFYQNSKNLGFAKANNIGIQHALEKFKTDYCLLLNQDTVVQSNLLEQLIYWHKTVGPAALSPKILIKKNNHIWWIGTKIYSFKELLKAKRLAVSYHVNKEEADTFSFQEPLELQVISGCSLFLPCEIIRKVGFLDERFFMYMEDLDYSLRMREMGYYLFLIPNTVVFHDVNLEKDALKKDKNLMKTICRYSQHVRSTILVLWKHFSWFYILVWFLKLPATIIKELFKRIIKIS